MKKLLPLAIAALISPVAAFAVTTTPDPQIQHYERGTDYRYQLSTAVGATGDGDMTWRVGFGLPWNWSWWETSIGHLTGYWDIGYTYWEGGNEGSGNHSLDFAPVFVYEFDNNWAMKPFVEAGVGLAAFADTRVSDKQLGSSVNFVTRLGFGLRFLGNQKLGVRAMHYSNAGLVQPNDGVESYSLFYSYDF